MKKIWSVIRAFLVLVGFVVVTLAVVGFFQLREANPPLPSRMVLSYTFHGTPKDAPAASAWVSEFVPVAPTLAQVTGALYKAAQDTRVEVLVVRLAAGDYNWANVQELRAAIAAFKAAGKRAYVYAESYGDVSSGMAMYYLASVFDEIWLQPIGAVAITGFHAEMPYFKKVLDFVGVSPEIIQKGHYKTAPENALLEHMSDAQRESIKGVLASMTTDFFDAVTSGRKMPVATIGPLIDGAPYTADEAKKKNLVDTVGYDDELMAKLLSDNARKLVDVTNYFNSQNVVQSLEKQKNKGVAVVYLNGMIVSGSAAGFSGDDRIYADDIADLIQNIARDDAMGAIVLRVDSPGGSPAASETIRRAVVQAKAKGKYVVVSIHAAPHYKAHSSTTYSHLHQMLQNPNLRLTSPRAW